MIRTTDKTDNVQVVTIDKAELRRRIENLYDKLGDPLPSKWVLEIDLGEQKAEVRDATK